MTFLIELQNDIPVTSHLAAIILLIINIFLPGIGTMIMSCIDGFRGKTLLVGIIQFLTFPIIIGWIWSIWWGIICLDKSRKLV